MRPVGCMALHAKRIMDEMTEVFCAWQAQAAAGPRTEILLSCDRSSASRWRSYSKEAFGPPTPKALKAVGSFADVRREANANSGGKGNHCWAHHRQPNNELPDIAIEVTTPESSIKRRYAEFLERRSAQTTEITPARDDDVIDMNALSPNPLARLAVYEMAMGGSPCGNMLESFAQLCKEADLPASKATVWWDFQIFGIKLKHRSKRPWCGEQGWRHGSWLA